jgi:hypothetical protein
MTKKTNRSPVMMDRMMNEGRAFAYSVGVKFRKSACRVKVKPNIDATVAFLFDHNPRMAIHVNAEQSGMHTKGALTVYVVEHSPSFFCFCSTSTPPRPTTRRVFDVTMFKMGSEIILVSNSFDIAFDLYGMRHQLDELLYYV